MNYFFRRIAAIEIQKNAIETVVRCINGEIARFKELVTIRSKYEPLLF